MCMPDEQYSGEYPTTAQEDGSTKHPNPTTRHARPKDGNSPKDLKFNEAFRIKTGAYLGYKIQPRHHKQQKSKLKCAQQWLLAMPSIGTPKETLCTENLLRQRLGNILVAKKQGCLHNILHPQKPNAGAMDTIQDIDLGMRPP